VHGGGFVQGGRGQLKGYGIGLGRLGYTCLACEYRLAPEAKWPAQIDDVHTALAFLHREAEGLGLDRDRIATAGNSAGGQLAMMTGAEGRWPVAAIIALYSASDFLGPGARAHGAPQAMTFLVDDISEEALSAMSTVN